MATSKLHANIHPSHECYDLVRDGIVEGPTVEAINTRLAAMGYEGHSLEVRDEAGFARGWVDGVEWRSAA